MISKACWVMAVGWLGCCGASALAQQKPVAPQKRVTVTVVDAHVEPASPVAAVTVSLTYLDGSTGITDARGVTNPRGEAFLQVSADTAQRDDLRIALKNTQLVIFEPADGQLHGISGSVPVKLVPKGSAVLAGPAQIEAVQRRLSQQVDALKAQTKAQKQAVDAGLEEWARANGLDLQAAQTKVVEWARGIQAQPGVSAERRALAAFALKNYGAAADLFGEATDDEMASLDALKKQQQEQNRAALQKILETTKQRANALQLASRYHDATAALVKTRVYLALQLKASPDDGGLRGLWLNAMNATAGVRMQEGEVAPAGESAGLLAQALTDYQSMQREYAAAGDRPGVAKAQVGIGIVLDDEAVRASGAKAAELFDQAVQAYRSALEVYTKANLPQDWALTQMGLGNALLRAGERASGDKAAGLFDQAVQAYRSALEVYTKADLPQYWANTQMNLGVALSDEGDRASGDKAAGLLDQAVQAYRSALEVYTKADLPQYWAATQVNLGNALDNEGVRASGDKAVGLLDEAVQAFRSALEVYTKADLPQYWATTQMNLGLVLVDEGERARGDKAAGLFDQAVQAYRSALEVNTKADLPQGWAKAQVGLGSALEDEGELASGDKAAGLLDQAVQAYRSALEVYTKADLPQDWARTQMNLGVAHAAQGDYAAAALDYESFLDVIPDSVDVLDAASSLYHDKLYRFDRALALDERRLKVDSSNGVRLDFMEANLTAAHFDVCVQQAAILDDTKLRPGAKVVRDTLKMACQWAGPDTRAASMTTDHLLSEASAVTSVGWNFRGTLHFLAESPAFEKGRPSWISLFTAVQNKDAAAMTKALHELEPLMQN